MELIPTPFRGEAGAVYPITGWRGRKRLLLLAFMLPFGLSICLFDSLSSLAQASDGLWKTYLEAADKAKDDKNYDDAEKLYKLAEAKAEMFGEADERYAKTAANLTLLYLAQRKFTAAEGPYRKLLASLDKGAGAESQTNAASVLSVAQNYHNEKRYQEAEPLYKFALEIYKRGMKPTDTNVATTYLNYQGSNYLSEGKYKEAEQVFKEELGILENDPVLRNGSIITYNLGYLALVARAQQKYEEAERYLKRALEIVRSLHGENHPQTAQMLKALGIVLEWQETKHAEAISIFQQALKIDEGVFGKTSKEVTQDLDFLAGVYKLDSNYAEAEAQWRRVLDIFDSIPSSPPDDITSIADHLLGIYLARRDYVQAEATCKRTRSILEKAQQKNIEGNLFLANCFLVVYRYTGDYPAEAESIRKFIGVQEQLGVEAEGVIAEKLVALASSYIRQQKYEDAMGALMRAQKFYDRPPANPNPALLYIWARYWYFTGKYAESERLFLQVLPLAAKDPNAAWYRKGYALVLYAQGKTEQADKLFRESLETLRTDKDDGERDIATSWHELAMLFAAQGKYAEAEPLFKQAIELREKAFGSSHPELAASLEGYVAMLKKLGRPGEAAPLETKAQAIRSKQKPR